MGKSAFTQHPTSIETLWQASPQLEKFEAKLSHAAPFTKHHAPRGWHADLHWWKSTLSAPISSPIPGPATLIDIHAYSDASSGYGIGLCIQGFWRSYRLLPGWRGHHNERDIGWAEAAGFHLLVLSFADLTTAGHHYKAWGDNEGVVEGWWSGRSRNRATNLLFRRTHEILASKNFFVHTRYIPSANNPADPFSRGTIGPLKFLLPRIPIPQYLSDFIIDYDEPLSPAELALPNSHPSHNLSSGLKRSHERLGFDQWRLKEEGRLLAAFKNAWYPSNLTPILSVLRPHCPARERLAKWCPASKRTFRDTTGHSLDLPDEFAERVQSVLTAGFAKSTLETYASGLLAFHVFCDSREIPELQRAPCSLDLLQSWIATMAGHYAGTSVKNYVHGVRAWHIIHGIEWKIDKAPIDAMIQGAERSKRKKRLPFTISYIESILTGLDPNDPFDAACGGCLTTSFYCAARVGELTVPNLRDFSASNHVTPSQIHETSDRNGFKTTVLHIPRTKSNQSEGEDIYFSKQLGSSDPDWWLRNQLRVNDPGPSDHLFAYKHLSGRHITLRPLTKSAFLRRIQKIAQTRGLPVIQGHGIRIGATLEYLLRGVPFDAVRVIGRWKSDAFLLYLRKHAEIMAPYLQPELHQSLIQYTMPPVRCKCSPLAWVSANITAVGTRGPSALFPNPFSLNVHTT
ncbi:hypothetical protein HHX47_DHR9000467 [Lentinula edodes]|nr:hypothetical protein HHX47_DHR9000467 [Lentinula edodes]